MRAIPYVCASPPFSVLVVVHLIFIASLQINHLSEYSLLLSYIFPWAFTFSRSALFTKIKMLTHFSINFFTSSIFCYPPPSSVSFLSFVSIERHTLLLGSLCKCYTNRNDIEHNTFFTKVLFAIATADCCGSGSTSAQTYIHRKYRHFDACSWFNNVSLSRSLYLSIYVTALLVC